MTTPSNAELIRMFELMSTAQRCDARLRASIAAGDLTAPYYSPRGQEAIAAAIGVVLGSADYLVTTYRGLHDQIAKGVDLAALVAEYYGRQSGLCRGNGGPMHISAPEVGLMLTTGIVGGGLPVANGLALASQLRRDGRVTVVSFGDGAVNIGAFHEALNLAALWSLPVVFLCQNNRFAEHTAFRSGTNVEHVADRAAAYLMPGQTIDGNDPLAVLESVAAAVERARSGGGPTLIEAVTYRFFGHVLGDAMEYMDPEERQAALEADPVPRFRNWLVENEHSTAASLDELEAEINARIDDAVQLSLASPTRRVDEIESDVYTPAGERGAGSGVTTQVDTSERRLGAAIREALDVALASDPSVFLLGEDIADPGGGVFRITRGLSAKHGTDRVRATPISEQAIIGAAIGAALAGMRPVAEIMIMNFLAVCLDQLTNHAAKLRFMSGGRASLPMTVRCSAGAGMQFGAQHSDMLEAWLCHVPGLKVVVPSTPADAKGLLLSCIFDDDPCVFVEQTMSYATKGPVDAGDVRVPLGRAAVRRKGTDLTLLAYGRQVALAVEAAERLETDGISTSVIDVRTLVPLDEETVVAEVAETGRGVVVHEAVGRCGFGAELVAVITERAFGDLRAPIGRVTALNIPVPYAAELEQAYLPSVEDVVAAARLTLA